jgi:hypothetical protein
MGGTGTGSRFIIDKDQGEAAMKFHIIGRFFYTFGILTDVIC